MKLRKITLIPASVLCLGALFSCGKTNDSIMSGLKNGFESVKFEKYLKLPSKAFQVDANYGNYVRENARVNTFKYLRSTDATNFEVGTSPFFSRMPIFTPGTKDRDRSSFNQNTSSNKYEAAVQVSPFSNNVSKRTAQTTVEFYEGDNPVIREKETSIRMDYDAYSKTTIKSAPTNDEFIVYSDKTPDDKNAIYTLYKGSNALNDIVKSPSAQSNKEPTGNTDIVFKRMIEEGVENPKEKLAKFAQRTLSTQFSKLDSAEAECATFNSLSKMPWHFSNEVTINTEIPVTYLSNGKDTIYIYAHGVSDQTKLPVVDNLNDDSTIPTVNGYSTSTMVGSVKYNKDLNLWLVNDMTTAFKVYTMADENLVSYSTPRCLCSEYRHIDLNYKDLGDFGKIEDAKLYESPNFKTQFTFTNLEGGRGETRTDVFDPLYDENMYTNGGVYDHTFSAREAGLIDKNSYLFYGEIQIGNIEFETNEGNVTSSHYCFKTELVDKDDNKITITPNDDTIYESLKDVLRIYDQDKDKLEFYQGASETNYAPATLITTINVYIEIKENAGEYEVVDFTINPSGKF